MLRHLLQKFGDRQRKRRDIASCQRAAKDDEDIVLHFDLVTPWTMSDAEQSELLSKLVYQLRDVNPHLRVAAELDKPFMHTHSGVEDAEARARASFEVEQAEKAGRK